VYHNANGELGYFETIASSPGFDMVAEGPLSYSGDPNMRARRTQP
jgi:hypothetical protein